MASLEDFVNASPDANDFRVPELPDVAELVKSNGFNGGLQRFNELLREWRTNLERAIIERLKALTVTTVATPTATVTPSVAPNLQPQVSNLSAGLSEHIADTSAHGTDSNVVGVIDEQVLEKKTIGMSSPRAAKFTQITTQNTIAAGKTVTINAGENMVVGGPLTVNGVLVINGYLRVIA